MTETGVEDALGVALARLISEDAYLLEIDAGERTVCARLAMYLQDVFPDAHVDVEYNRHEAATKRLENIGRCGSSAARVYPDIIVHRRGNDDGNLLVIEAKLSTNGTSRDCDRAKLEGFVEEYGYRYALLLDLPAGRDAGGEPHLEWIARG
jgi:hypothetical protein